MTRFGFLVRELALRDLRVRYAGSAFGFVWAFLHPIWQLLLYGLVFSVILRLPLTGERTTSFAAFLFAGLLPWMAFQEGVTRGATAILENAQMVKKLRFPSQVLVHAVVVSAFVHAGIALVLFTGWQVARGEVDWTHLHWLGLGLAGQLAMTGGLALLVASLQVYLRDVVQGLGLVMSAFFYVTPIVYPSALVPAPLRGWIEINPLATIVALDRSFLIAGDPPSPTSLAALFAACSGLFALGIFTFRRLSPGFSDEL
jgi:ABC-type polysaccharide/polyol phosphate export permease